LEECMSMEGIGVGDSPVAWCFTLEGERSTRVTWEGRGWRVKH